MSIHDVGFRLYPADSSEGIPVFPESATFGHDALMNGQAVLTFHAGDEALDLMGSTLGEEFPEVVVRVMHESQDAPIWSGPALSTHLSTQRRGRVAVTFEHFWQHIHRRRTVLAAAYAATDKSIAADNAALEIQRAQIGPSPTVPVGFPGARTDFGSFTPTVPGNHSAPPPLAPGRRHIEQSGNNLLDVTNGLYEAADLAPVLADPATGALTIDNAYPFRDADLLEDVIFGQYRGNLASFELTSDRGELANVWLIEGKTANSPRATSSAASITAWGEIEAFAQKPEDTNVNAALDQVATDLRDQHADPKVTYKAELIQNDGHRYVEDFFWRDLIRIEESIFGLVVEQEVRAWQMQVARGRVTKTDLVLGVPRVGDLQKHLTSYAGTPGPRMAGSPWRNRRQS